MKLHSCAVGRSRNIPKDSNWATGEMDIHRLHSHISRTARTVGPRSLHLRTDLLWYTRVAVLSHASTTTEINFLLDRDLSPGDYSGLRDLAD